MRHASGLPAAPKSSRGNGGQARRLRSPTDMTRLPRLIRPSAAALRCRRKFLRIFLDGFRDETYLAWERDYKWDAHQQWTSLLDQATYRSLRARARLRRSPQRRSG